ncbi:MAG: hypothetical protein V7739_04550 [Motiliproteus sp.]
MALDRTVEYTIEQAVALLAGKISLQALNNKSKPVQKYCREMFDSKGFWESSAVNRYYQQIVSDIWQGELRTCNNQVLIKVPTGSGQYRVESIHQSEITDEFELSAQTRFTRAELRHWVASHKEAHSFLMNDYELSVARGEGWDVGKQEFLDTEGFAETIEPATSTTASADLTAETPLSEELTQIQALLNGTHEFQAEELRVALQAWLDVSARFKKGELNDDPSTELKNWVASHLDDANDYQVSRVSCMANWDSKHPTLRLVQ